MGVLYQVTHPGFQISHQEQGNGIYMLEENIDAQILLLRYLLDGNPVMSSGKLISYHDLPWGEVYYRQFQGRCISRLARSFGTRLPPRFSFRIISLRHFPQRMWLMWETL